jgi:hypothetical protein
MNSKECLKHICDECQINAGKIQVACPFRSISNEYCDKYETIKKDLDRLKQLEKENQGVKDDNTRLWHSIEYANNEIAKLKKAIDILKENLFIQFEEVNDCLMVKLKEYKDQDCDYTIMFLDNKEDYELLKEVLDFEY